MCSMLDYAENKGIEKGIEALIEAGRSFGQTYDSTMQALMEKFPMDREAAKEKMALYWKNEIS